MVRLYPSEVALRAPLAGLALCHGSFTQAGGQPGEVGRKLGVLCYQQQGAAADFPVVQLVVLERGRRDAQHVGELRPAEAELLTQLT